MVVPTCNPRTGKMGRCRSQSLVASQLSLFVRFHTNERLLFQKINREWFLWVICGLCIYIYICAMHPHSHRCMYPPPQTHTHARARTHLMLTLHLKKVKFFNKGRRLAHKAGPLTQKDQADLGQFFWKELQGWQKWDVREMCRKMQESQGAHPCRRFRLQQIVRNCLTG